MKMSRQASLSQDPAATREDISKIAIDLLESIPRWLQELPEAERITLEIGIAAKCSICAEQLLNNVYQLMSLDMSDSKPSASYGKEKLTLGEVVRRIKSLQKQSRVFADVNGSAIGQLFALLDRIVGKRNRTIHMKKGFSENDIGAGDLLLAVYELCNSWLLDKVTGQSLQKRQIVVLTTVENDDAYLFPLISGQVLTIG